VEWGAVCFLLQFEAASLDCGSIAPVCILEPYRNMAIFMVLTATGMKMAVFWDVAPCCLLETDRRFRGDLMMTKAVCVSGTPVSLCQTTLDNFTEHCLLLVWRYFGNFKRSNNISDEHNFTFSFIYEIIQNIGQTSVHDVCTWHDAGKTGRESTDLRICPVLFVSLKNKYCKTRETLVTREGTTLEWLFQSAIDQRWKSVSKWT
jgi:hypothetical protein